MRPRLLATGLPGKTKVLCTFIMLLFVGACRVQNEPAPTGPISSETVVSSTPPFETKEPDRYSATRTITIVAPDGETMVTKSSIIRDGEMRRYESEIASKKIAYLNVPEGKFVLLPDARVYSDQPTESDRGAGEDEFSPETLLHSETTNTTYQKIGTEVVGGRNSTKYRIVVNSSTPGSVSLSETLIWFDETLKMPVRSETTSADGTKMTMELLDVTFDVDQRFFQVPVDYQKIAFSEFRKLLTKTD